MMVSTYVREGKDWHASERGRYAERALRTGAESAARDAHRRGKRSARCAPSRKAQRALPTGTESAAAKTATSFTTTALEQEAPTEYVNALKCGRALRAGALCA